MISRTLSIIDYIVLVILLASSAVIGLIFGVFKSKKNSAKEFLLADGTMGIFPTALSILVSFVSAIGLLGVPTEIYVYGTMYGYQVISGILASTITALIFMPKFRKMKFTSIYEYLEIRFDRRVRMCVVFAYSFLMLLYMAIVLYAPASALSQTTGLNIWLSIISMGAICTFYSSIGGMKAVIWTDVLQAIVILVGFLAFIIQGFIVLGGVKRTFSIAAKGGRLEFDSVSFHPHARHTIWSLVLGGGLSSISTYSFNQIQVQRYMCVRTTRDAQKALLINTIGHTFVVISCCTIGIILYAYYVDCDPYTAKYISSIDQLYPYFVMEVFSDKKGLPGIFLACIFSGSLSTISSGLNSLAAVFIEDLYKGLIGKQISDERQGFISKLLSILLGIIVMLLAYVVSYLGSILTIAISLFGALSGPIMGVFFLGLFFPQANNHGGFIGFLISIFIQLWLLLGAQLTKNQMKNVRLPLSVANCPVPVNMTTRITIPTRSNPLLGFYSISYMWYSTIAVCTVLTVGIIVSYLTRPNKQKEIDPKLIIHVNDLCGSCLPKRIREWLRYNVTDDVDLEKKVPNDTQSTAAKDLNTVHDITIQKIFDTNIRTISSLDVVIKRTIDGAYDNPAMLTRF
ncbi:unnamed protein product [Rotaria sp. Silwood1]|nr:unnamed protein product [Rotaria sp. Silwood1]CAF1599779.1 unnamed protein product [Rotaria sp. Silwood1]CAF3688737.1 unnamed protein product [Rotaria sp. Silwood1]CAF3706081.1 unnamed protein product [Rotaria sp. Silwood1]CAF4762509.1 unnamed protein product [Rotaria sp. Silwood1]